MLTSQHARPAERAQHERYVARSVELSRAGQLVQRVPLVQLDSYVSYVSESVGPRVRDRLALCGRYC